MNRGGKKDRSSQGFNREKKKRSKYPFVPKEAESRLSSPLSLHLSNICIYLSLAYLLIKAILLSGDIINRKGKVLGEIKMVGRGCLGVGETIYMRNTVPENLVPPFHSGPQNFEEYKSFL